jgi:hypothetical protein
MAIITNNISGSSSGASMLGITGSVIFANRQQNAFPSMPGSDAVFFVSGSRGSDVSVFGGDLIVSGGLSTQGDIVEITGSLIVTSGISGSLTKLNDGTSYIIAGSNVTVTSSSNGPVIISAASGGSWPGTTPAAPDSNDVYVYNFDETSGVTFANSGAGVNGTLSLTGSAYLASKYIAKSQSSVRFMGLAGPDGAFSASTESIGGSGSLTLEAYVVTRENDLFANAVFVSKTGSLNGAGIAQYYTGGGFASFWTAAVVIGGVVKDTSFVTTPKVQVNVPTHLAMTYDHTTGQLRMYVNGIEIALNNTGLGALPNLDYIQVANADLPGIVGNTPFRGDITQVRISNVARSASYILERAQNCFGL